MAVSMVPNKFCFEEARKLYPGRCRGFDDEWENIVKESKKPGWRRKRRTLDNVCPLLKPAIEAQIAYRESCKEWCPQWKHFATWINGGWWTEEIPQTRKPKHRRCFHCGAEDVVSQTIGKPWRCWRDECKTEYDKL